MTPNLRDMPVIRTAWERGRGYRLGLPDGTTRYARDRDEARVIVARFAYGAALDFIGDPKPKH